MSATITITLPPDLEQLVAAKAAADGKGLEEYTLAVLRKDAELPSLRELFADVRADIEARGISDEEVEQDIEAALAEVRARRRA
jgi:hypothetical protein